jgi:osmotically-inducible protein OsmY
VLLLSGLERRLAGAGDQRQEAAVLNDAHSGAEVRASVVAELDWDPRLDSQDISVTAEGGAVTLRGTVGSLRQVRQARHAAQRVHGVTSVSNQLTVLPMTAGHRDDHEVGTAVLRALMFNSTIPATVNAEAHNGVVRLTGSVSWHWQREEAEQACASVAGVLGIADHIKLIPAPTGTDIQEAIMAAFRRNAPLSLDDLSVDVAGVGVVILSGTVNTWAEHDEAIATAWSAPGVAQVDDRVAVWY